MDDWWTDCQYKSGIVGSRAYGESGPMCYKILGLGFRLRVEDLESGIVGLDFLD